MLFNGIENENGLTLLSNKLVKYLYWGRILIVLMAFENQFSQKMSEYDIDMGMGNASTLAWLSHNWVLFIRKTLIWF